MKYEIIINEAQRVILLQAFRALESTISLEDEMCELLGDMLEALPQDEAEDPGCTHDFTL